MPADGSGVIIGSVDAESGAYVERYRLTWPAAGAVAGDGGFLAAVLVLPVPFLVRAMTVAVFGWFAVMTLAVALTRREAFRADSAGLMLGRSPFRYAATTRMFGWREVIAVSVWRRDLIAWWPGRVGLRYVGIQRRPGSPPLAGHLANVPAGAFAPGFTAPPGMLAGTSRVISCWRMDDSKLAAAISAFAPHVDLRIHG